MKKCEQKFDFERLLERIEALYKDAFQQARNYNPPDSDEDFYEYRRLYEKGVAYQEAYKIILDEIDALKKRKQGKGVA